MPGLPDPFETARRRMVEDQLRMRGIRDERVLAAMRKLPRHRFVPRGFEPRAYDDRPLSIGSGQTISQPYIIALMTERLQAQPGSKVLEVGTGSGYQAAVLAETGARVYSVERVPQLAAEAKERLQALGLAVKIRVGDGTAGWPEEAPFERIMVTACAPSVPGPLAEQLGEGGRMVIPVGEGLSQQLLLVERRQGEVKQSAICGCLFVPLFGRHGWQDGEADEADPELT